jgi:hypothetical protein
MPQSLLTGQLKEKPTYRVWCLYSSFVHAPQEYQKDGAALSLPSANGNHSIYNATRGRDEWKTFINSTWGFKRNVVEIDFLLLLQNGRVLQRLHHK